MLSTAGRTSTAATSQPSSMRRSVLFGQTLRETPADAEGAGYQLLLRAGFVQPLASGIYSFLPLGERVREKLQGIIRTVMASIEGQEISMPVVQPGDLWRESGRWNDIGAEMVRFRDRTERDMVLAMTHEEVTADLLRKHVRSYRQLPVMLYQIQTKFRDEPRARGGLIRLREFVMNDAYSAHATQADLDAYYPRVYDAYFRIFRGAGLDVLAVESDVGMMGGTEAHEFIYPSEIGEDRIVVCDSCGYAANRQVATTRKSSPEAESALPLQEVATPDTMTIAALAELLRVPASRTAKAAFFMAGHRLVFAVVRGDMEVNETKLANAVGATELRPARADELDAAGIVAGYASPIGVKGATVVADDLVSASPNLVAGANRAGFHLLNTNVPRDYRPDIVADIVSVSEGMPCPSCTSPVRLISGVEVGNTFKLGTRYNKALNVTFLDPDGQMQHAVMASYGIGIERLMGCIAQKHHDPAGLIWPIQVAPFQVYLIGLDLQDETVRQRVDRLYDELDSLGVEVLFDDRNERAGVKFNDADLIGLPLRLTVSRRTVERDAVEQRNRATGDTRDLPLRAAAGLVAQEVQELLSAASPAS